MSDTDPLLDRAAIERSFLRLGERLARRGLVADVYVIGGAAIAMAYNARRATRDIDAVFEPHGAVIEEAWAVACSRPSGAPSESACMLTMTGCRCR